MTDETKDFITTETTGADTQPQTEPKPQEDQQESKPKVLQIEIHPPDTITLEHLGAYWAARSKYKESQGAITEDMIIDFIGGIELWRRGWFRIEAPEEVMQYLRPYQAQGRLTHILTTPPILITVIVSSISRVVEASLYNPLLNGQPLKIG